MLNGVNLRGAIMSEATLINASIVPVQLIGDDGKYSGRDWPANVSSVDLSGANLNGADLSYANLNDSDLSDADLTGANLTEARTNATNINGAVLSGATLPRPASGSALV